MLTVLDDVVKFNRCVVIMDNRELGCDLSVDRRVIVGVTADSFNYGADLYLLSACRLVGLRSLDRDFFAVLNINVFDIIIEGVFDSFVFVSDYIAVCRKDYCLLFGCYIACDVVRLKCKLRSHGKTCLRNIFRKSIAAFVNKSDCCGDVCLCGVDICKYIAVSLKSYCILFWCYIACDLDRLICELFSHGETGYRNIFCKSLAVFVNEPDCCCDVCSFKVDICDNIAVCPKNYCLLSGCYIACDLDRFICELRRHCETRHCDTFCKRSAASVNELDCCGNVGLCGVDICKYIAVSLKSYCILFWCYIACDLDRLICELFSHGETGYRNIFCKSLAVFVNEPDCCCDVCSFKVDICDNIAVCPKNYCLLSGCYIACDLDRFICELRRHCETRHCDTFCKRSAASVNELDCCGDVGLCGVGVCDYIALCRKGYCLLCRCYIACDLDRFICELFTHGEILDYFIVRNGLAVFVNEPDCRCDVFSCGVDICDNIIATVSLKNYCILIGCYITCDLDRLICEPLSHSEVLECDIVCKSLSVFVNESDCCGDICSCCVVKVDNRAVIALDRCAVNRRRVICVARDFLMLGCDGFACCCAQRDRLGESCLGSLEIIVDCVLRTADCRRIVEYDVVSAACLDGDCLSFGSGVACDLDGLFGVARVGFKTCESLRRGYLDVAALVVDRTAVILACGP